MAIRPSAKTATKRRILITLQKIEDRRTALYAAKKRAHGGGAEGLLRWLDRQTWRASPPCINRSWLSCPARS